MAPNRRSRFVREFLCRISGFGQWVVTPRAEIVLVLLELERGHGVFFRPGRLRRADLCAVRRCASDRREHPPREDGRRHTPAPRGLENRTVLGVGDVVDHATVARRFG